MLIQDIKTKKTYMKDGQEKTIWLNVGCLKTTDGGKSFVELNMFPNTPFFVFDRQEKVSAPPAEVNEQEIPF